MYRISMSYNKVPIERLEKWNGITNDEAKAGMKLIVGYLKVKKDLSPLAAASGKTTPATSTATTTTPPVTTKVETRQPEVTAKQETRPVTPEKKPEEKKPVTETGLFNRQLITTVIRQTTTVAISATCTRIQERLQAALLVSLKVRAAGRTQNIMR